MESLRRFNHCLTSVGNAPLGPLLDPLVTCCCRGTLFPCGRGEDAREELPPLRPPVAAPLAPVIDPRGGRGDSARLLAGRLSASSLVPRALGLGEVERMPLAADEAARELESFELETDRSRRALPFLSLLRAPPLLLCRDASEPDGLSAPAREEAGVLEAGSLLPA